jgi:hypothetical protein
MHPARLGILRYSFQYLGKKRNSTESSTSLNKPKTPPEQVTRLFCYISRTCSLTGRATHLAYRDHRAPVLATIHPPSLTNSPETYVIVAVFEFLHSNTRGLEVDDASL